MVEVTGLGWQLQNQGHSITFTCCVGVALQQVGSGGVLHTVLGWSHGGAYAWQAGMVVEWRSWGGMGSGWQWQGRDVAW